MLIVWKSTNTSEEVSCGKEHHTFLHKTETVDPPLEESSSDH